MVVQIVLSIHKQVLYVGGEHVVVWEGVHVETFKEISVYTLA